MKMLFEKLFNARTEQLQALVFAKKRLLAAISCATLFICLWFQFFRLSEPSSWKDSAKAGMAKISFKFSSSDARQIANGTLGFGAMFALGLADRTDKRDSLELAASVTGLKFTWIDGANGKEMNQKAIPPGWKPGGEVGCWRGHMNIMQKIVKEGISSALIVEDDADWDVNIVTQMQQYAQSIRVLLDPKNPTGPSLDRADGTTSPTTGSPYGEGWDIFWIGHCGGSPGTSLNKTSAIIRGDNTVPPAMAITDWLWSPEKWKLTNNCSAHLGRDPKGLRCDSPRLAPDERLVMEGGKGLCTVGYAVSYQGARKYLAKLGGLSLEDAHNPVDIEMGNMCSNEKDLPGETTRCFGVSPPYIRSHRPRGPTKGDSDIQGTSKDGYRDIGETKGIMYSAKLNALNVITGSPLESQYVQDKTVTTPKLNNLGGSPEGLGGWRLREKGEYKHA